MTVFAEWLEHVQISLADGLHVGGVPSPDDESDNSLDILRPLVGGDEGMEAAR